MKKYIPLLACLACLYSCCNKNVTSDYGDVVGAYLYIENPHTVVGNVDSLTYHGLGSSVQETIYAYADDFGGVKTFYVPLELRYKTDSCSFIINWHNVVDTVTLSYVKKVVKEQRCYGSAYTVNFFANTIKKISLDTTKVNYQYDTQGNRSVSTIYATY